MLNEFANIVILSLYLYAVQRKNNIQYYYDVNGGNGTSQGYLWPQSKTDDQREDL